MKKHILIFVVLIFILSIFASCAESGSGANKTPGDVTVNEESVRINKVKSFSKIWSSRKGQFAQSDNVTKIEYVLLLQDKPQTYFSEDASLIERWKTLLPKFHFEIIDFKAHDGGINELNFYEGEAQTFLFRTPDFKNFHVRKDETLFMLKTINYEELRDEIFSLLSDMGVPYSEIPGV